MIYKYIIRIYIYSRYNSYNPCINSTTEGGAFELIHSDQKTGVYIHNARARI
jgi:hypothetical protein